MIDRVKLVAHCCEFSRYRDRNSNTAGVAFVDTPVLPSLVGRRVEGTHLRGGGGDTAHTCAGTRLGVEDYHRHSASRSSRATQSVVGGGGVQRGSEQLQHHRVNSVEQPQCSKHTDGWKYCLKAVMYWAMRSLGSYLSAAQGFFLGSTNFVFSVSGVTHQCRTPTVHLLGTLVHTDFNR